MTNLPEHGLPPKALDFFYRLTTWHETKTQHKGKVLAWSKAVKKLKCISCIKPKQNEKMIVPNPIGQNTFYVPTNYSGVLAIRALRNAFCHAHIQYNPNSDQLQICADSKNNIAGSFTLEAIQEFVDAFLNITNYKSKSSKS